MSNIITANLVGINSVELVDDEERCFDYVRICGVTAEDILDWTGVQETDGEFFVAVESSDEPLDYDHAIQRAVGTRREIVWETVS